MSNARRVAVLAGDAIGPEVMAEAVKVFDVVQRHRDVEFELIEAPFGAGAYFDHGKAFPDETKAICDSADAILKGPVGLSHEESSKIPVEEQPERGAILPLRARYNTYANFRPIFLPAHMAHFSPLKSEVIRDGIDIMLIRELVGGLYFGEKSRGVNSEGLRYVNEVLTYDETQIRQVLVTAFETARGRKGVLHNIHKSNVLMSSVFWNEVLDEVRVDYTDVEVRHMLVDAAATALCLNPGQFDVMVMENMFGDILSDQAGGLLGSLGLMPSACIGPEKAYYEPSHGSAPDIAGQGIANPYSMIGSVALMLEMSFGMPDEAEAVWKAMQSVFEDGFSTTDLASHGGVENVSTVEFGEKVVAKLESLLA
ncbi:MAG: 3-isopropylmalate dehydrogenase [Gammaproteobacteria bacterium]|nr:3-isopropylmalate dehydrogenase [Gammaproteobacteria bacterium]|tara:strand:- start:9302 stop:10405 length:1104 start_codon:yes stop_codon:yes gene_type:complete